MNYNQHCKIIVWCLVVLFFSVQVNDGICSERSGGRSMPSSVSTSSVNSNNQNNLENPLGSWGINLPHYSPPLCVPNQKTGKKTETESNYISINTPPNFGRSMYSSGYGGSYSIPSYSPYQSYWENSHNQFQNSYRSTLDLHSSNNTSHYNYSSRNNMNSSLALIDDINRQQMNNARRLEAENRRREEERRLAERKRQELLEKLNKEIKKHTEEISAHQKEIEKLYTALAEGTNSAESSLSKIKDHYKGIESKEKIIDTFSESKDSKSALDSEINNDLKQGLGQDAYDLLAEDKIIPPPEPPVIEFKSQGTPRQQLETIYQNLNKTFPRSIQGKNAKALGYVAVEESDKSYASGDENNGAVFKQYAQMFLDIATSIVPIINPATGNAVILKDFYEGITGRTIIDGRQLSSFERGTILAAATAGVGFSLATAGVFGGAAEAVTKAGLKAIVTLGKAAIKKGIDVGGAVLTESVGFAGKVRGAAAKLGVKAKEGINNFVGFSKRVLGNEIGAIVDIEKVAEKLKGAKGKVGRDFEEHLTTSFGGQGSFKAGGREFDGAIKNVWYEAKSGNYWTSDYGGKGFAKFKSDMGDRLRIAAENGKEYQLISNTPISTEAKEWLTQKGINFLEILE